MFTAVRGLKPTATIVSRSARPGENIQNPGRSYPPPQRPPASGGSWWWFSRCAPNSGRNSVPDELLVEPGVAATTGEQLVVGAALGDLPVFEHKNLMGVR